MHRDLEALGFDWDCGEQELATIFSHLPLEYRDEAYSVLDKLRATYWDTHNYHGGGVHFSSDFDPEAIEH